MIKDIAVNIISDTLFILAGLGFFWLLYILTKRKNLIDFFGLQKSKKIVIYVSNLNVEVFGSRGVDGNQYSFSGSAIASKESKAANSLLSLFRYFLPDSIEKPEILKSLLIQDIDAEILPSPREESEIDTQASIIAIGAPAYNLVSKIIQSNLQLFAKFDLTPILEAPYTTEHDDNGNDTLPYVQPSGMPPQDISVGWTISPNIINVSTSGSTVSNSQYSSTNPYIPCISVINRQPLTNTQYGFIQKSFDLENQRAVFYVAGLAEYSTCGSVHYLVKNWKKINDKYKDAQQFLILLNVNSANYEYSNVVYEK
jgi:hypothetical protein